MLHKLNYPLLALMVQAVAGPLLVLLKFLDIVIWSWVAVIFVPISLAVSFVLLGLAEHLYAQAALTFTMERKRPPRHIL
ncbi:MAG: hypothetical protein ACRYFK_17960 [Janthinobacterium lividum]